VASKRVLIVEDDSNVARELTHRLAALGFDVIKQTTTGEAAIVETASLVPDLVIVDLDVKGAIPGERVVTELCRIVDLPIIRIVAASLLGIPPVDRELHPIWTIGKPFHDRELAAVLSAALIKKRTDAAMRESHGRHDRLLHETGDPVVQVQVRKNESVTELKILGGNVAFENLLAITAAQFVGKDIRQLLPSLDELWIRMLAEPSHDRTLRAELRLDGGDHPVPVAAWRSAPDTWTVLIRQMSHTHPAKAVWTDTADLKQSNAFLRNLLDSSSTISIVSTDLHGMVEFWNQGAENLFGYTATEMVGKTSIGILYPPGEKGTQAVVQEIQESVIRGKRTISRELQEVCKDGRHLWIRVTVSPRLDARGNVIGLLGVGEDITRRTELEESARRSRETLESILGSLTDAVYSLSADDGTILHVNAAAERLYGKNLEQLLRTPQFWLEAVHPEDRGHLDNRFDEILREGAKDTTYRVVRPNGDIRWVYDRCVLVKDEGGRPQRIDCLLSDITWRVKAEEELQTSLREKELLLREIHHRIKNNLTMVSSLLSLQEQHSQGKDVGEILREAMTRIRSMGLIHGRLYESPSLSDIDAADYARSLVAELANIYGRGNVQVNYELENLPLDVDNAIPYGLIINELVTNALKYAFPSGRSGKVMIRLASVPPSGFFLEVADNGVGFASDLDPQNVTSLGMSIIRLLTEQLGGKAEFQTHDGACVRVTVPALRRRQH
jgi:PAS domain S-box-containing protein